MNKEYIRQFLKKETKVNHEKDNIDTNFRIRDLSWELAENVKMLHNSGCVVQRPDGEVYAVPHDEVEKELAKFSEEHRKLYV